MAADHDVRVVNISTIGGVIDALRYSMPKQLGFERGIGIGMQTFRFRGVELTARIWSPRRCRRKGNNRPKRKPDKAERYDP